MERNTLEKHSREECVTDVTFYAKRSEKEKSSILKMFRFEEYNYITESLKNRNCSK